MNDTLVHGQLIGGMAQGIGQALMERIVYDEYGQLLTGLRLRDEPAVVPPHCAAAQYCGH
jgi:CO/xanthine dehydrogenase Mo-binding subunit